MNTRHVRFFISLLVLLASFNIASGQLFESHTLYPNTSTIEGHYYNGTGGGDFHTIAYVDSMGRTSSTDHYFEKQLVSRTTTEYDEHHNQLFVVNDLEPHGGELKDTVKYSYKYDDDRIVYQHKQLSLTNTSEIRLLENHGDSMLIYEETDRHYRAKTDKIVISKYTYTLRLKNGLVFQKKLFDNKMKTTVITNYEYFDNGFVKRRFIERIPITITKGIYSGGLGSDDEYYKYKVDSRGRVTKYYKIIEGKKYKMASYRYK